MQALGGEKAPPTRAVLAEILLLKRRRFAPLPELRKGGFDGPKPFRRRQRLKAQPACLQIVARVAAHAEKRVVGVDQFAVEIESDRPDRADFERRAEPGLALTQRLTRHVRLGDVRTFAEHSYDACVGVRHRLIDEVQIARIEGAVRLSKADRRGLSDKSLAGRENAVERLEVSLAVKIGKGLPDRPANPVLAAEELAVSGIDIFDAMLGTTHGDDKSRRLLERLEEPVALAGDPPLRQDPLSRFDDDGDDPSRFASLVQDRRIIQVHPNLFGPAMAIERQLKILVGQGFSGQADLHDVIVEVGDLRPALSNL